MAVVARGDFPAANSDELVAYAAKVTKEGKSLTYASVGNGSFYHLLGGQIDIFITPYGAPHVEMDKLEMARTFTARRSDRATPTSRTFATASA